MFLRLVEPNENFLINVEGADTGVSAYGGCRMLIVSLRETGFDPSHL